ncbi:MAG: hypothetical protein EOP51_20800, partial [Sphingobacteriales bacterium]
SFNNGGTAIGCGTATISWTKSPCLGNWYVYYSDNNGASYSMIAVATDNGLANQSYTWSVPNDVNSTTGKIRINNVNNFAISDESDGNFSIIPSNDITVTSPNGGESLAALTNHVITWTNLPTASGQYTVRYSTNGVNWTTIASNITGNSYNWSVPNIPSSTCYIRVIDYVNSCKYDVTDAPFTIVAATPVLSSPNVAQTWQLGCSYNITWLSSTLYSTAKIDYSLDNGSTWTQIVSNAANSGSYAWTVPTTLTPSTQCLIRISNTGNLALNDVSSAPFTIGVPLTVTSFNNGGTAIGCGTATISWTKSPCLGNWYVYYSDNNGASYSMIAVATDNGLANQSYTWSVPNDVNSTTGKIKINNVNNFAISDESDGNFSIIPSNDITVTSPNGGETLTGLSTQSITWTNLPTSSGQYNVQYSTNNGSSYSTIASNVTGNSYTWNVPNLNAPNCRIRIQDNLNTCKNDVSDASFSITPATPALISPNVAQTWQLGCAYNITWLTSTLYTTVKIDYSVDNGLTWVQITGNAANNGTYAWTVPTNLAPSTQCLIRISNTGNLALNDVSNAPFTIGVPVTVTSFNSGETAIGCGTATISFRKSTCLGNWYIYYSIDNGVSYSFIATVTESGAAIQSYSWLVPNDINVNTAKIKVVNANYSSVSDESDGNFSIIPSNDITVTSPNGGESLAALTNHVITWTNLPTASGQYIVRYSTNGVNWTTIANNITGNSYNWSVPNIPSSTCFIRVIDYVNNCKYDVSDAAFTIVAATPVLTSPNVAQTWQLGCAYNITWNPATLYSTARIDYSADGGTTWTNIATNASNSGTYSWTIPTTLLPSANYIIRISNTGNVGLNDVSNAPFTIALPVTITSFNNGGTLTGCSTANISFSKSTCLGNWSIYYSIDNGSSYNFITTLAENGSSTQTYPWLVPNDINVATAKIRVTNATYTSISDESDGNFSIVPSNDITVTTANGGESWQGLSVKTISWTNLPGASGQYTIRYSVNNGSTWTSIASNITGNSYNWTLPNLSSSQCLIKVIDYINTCKFDNSDAVFTIVP